MQFLILAIIVATTIRFNSNANFSRIGQNGRKDRLRNTGKLDVRVLRVEITFERREEGEEGGEGPVFRLTPTVVQFVPSNDLCARSLARALIELCNYGVARL